MREDLLEGNGIFRTGSRFKSFECEDGPETKKWCKSDRQSSWPFIKPTTKNEKKGKFPLPKDPKKDEEEAAKVKGKNGKTVAPKERVEEKSVTYLKLDKKKKTVAKAYFDDGLWY